MWTVVKKSVAAEFVPIAEPRTKDEAICRGPLAAYDSTEPRSEWHLVIEPPLARSVVGEPSGAVVNLHGTG
jgi:hypothetical protein